MFVNPAGSGKGYQIANSVRFRSSASAYFSRTFGGAATNNKIATFSFWWKRGKVLSGTSDRIFGKSANLQMGFAFVDGVNPIFSVTTVTGRVDTGMVFRDYSAHYHIVVAFDTTQATDANKLKIWVNGVQQTLSGTFPALNTALPLDAASNAYICSADGAANFADGVLSQFQYADGQQLAATSFGQADPSNSNNWIPKAYSGTYGANGFWLKFDNGTSATTLGYDRSGNGNNWTASGISTTAGVTYDWMTDTPTNNYCTLNAVDPTLDLNNQSALSNANLTASRSGTKRQANASMIFSTGKWYWEGTATNGAGNNQFGWGNATALLASATGTYVVYDSGGNKYVNGTPSAYGATWTTNDVIGVAWDADGGTLTFYKNNVSQGTISSVTGARFPLLFNGAGSVLDVNFGQRPFVYTPPTGYKSLCTANRTYAAPTTSGSFTGNANADGTVVWLGGAPSTMTINGNAVTWGTHADKTAGGFKIRTASASYNASGSNTFSVSASGNPFGDSTHTPNTAQGNP